MKTIEQEKSFELRAYGWQELALLYNPYVAPRTASKRLTDWVQRCRPLLAELCEAGWQKGYKVLTPIQVAVLVKHLGEP